MLELEVHPGQGLCSEQIEIFLGMHISRILAAIHSLIGSVKDVDFIYCEHDPLSTEIIADLTNDGIRLYFDPINQRLKNIEVYDLSLLRLKYSDVLFNCPEVAPSISQIDQTFGATHPGVYNDKLGIFTITFRGLSFDFPADSTYQPYAALKQNLGTLRFPNGACPKVSKMWIYMGPSVAECSTPPLPKLRYSGLYHEDVEVLRMNQRETVGLRVRLHAISPVADEKSRVREVYFGDTVQDVLSALGSPTKIYYKSEDKMRIHAPTGQRRTAPNMQKSDCFYNYCTLGIDILFDARTNTVKKFMLHTNFPGHYHFNMYHRCQFHLPLNPSSGPIQHLHSTHGHQQQGLDVQSSKKQQQGLGGGQGEAFMVTTFTKWSEISEKIKRYGQPVVINRPSTTNTTNPFGSTFCYGYQDLIFEVMPNGHLGAVTLFEHPSHKGTPSRPYRRRRMQSQQLNVDA